MVLAGGGGRRAKLSANLLIHCIRLNAETNKLIQQLGWLQRNRIPAAMAFDFGGYCGDCLCGL